MPDMSVFEQQIQDRFAVAGRGRADALARLASEMQLRESSAGAFERWAGPFHTTVIRPAIEQLAQHLPGGAVEHYRTASGFFSTCRVDRTEAYPAFASVTIGLERDSGGSGTTATYQLSIIPMLISYEPVEQMALAAESSEELVTEWFTSRLLRFLETYLQVGLDPNYQQGAIRKDPVCGMMVAASLLPHREQIGAHTYYFCSDECHRRFVADSTLYTNDKVTLAGVR